eukprot:scaffold22009_cov38-Attheya_sp.AAC.2
MQYTVLHRDISTSRQTHMGWAGLSLCDELGEERELTEQEMLWCFYHQSRDSLHTDGCQLGLWRRDQEDGDGRDNVVVTTRTSAC